MFSGVTFLLFLPSECTFFVFQFLFHVLARTSTYFVTLTTRLINVYTCNLLSVFICLLHNILSPAIRLPVHLGSPNIFLQNQPCNLPISFHLSSSPCSSAPYMTLDLHSISYLFFNACVTAARGLVPRCKTILVTALCVSTSGGRALYLMGSA